MRLLFAVYLIFCCAGSFAQNARLIKGTVKSEKGISLEGVIVKCRVAATVTKTDLNGFYTIKAHSGEVILQFSLLGYQQQTIVLQPGENNVKDVILTAQVLSLDEVTVTNENGRRLNSASIDLTELKSYPAASGNFESFLKTQPGVSVNNELSYQYQVRGGSYNENLVYINDVELFKPSLISNGQQEGLSLVNAELAGSVGFSAGGFESRYGDKMSSVLNVRYNKPDCTSMTASVGLLGLSASYKGLFNNSFILAGFRAKTNKSILNDQPVKGSYQPDFYDFQLLAQSDLSPKFTGSVMSIYNFSGFKLAPQNRETVFGAQNQILDLAVNYAGEEEDTFQSWMGAMNFTWKPSKNLTFKSIISAFIINEDKTYDLYGAYSFDGTNDYSNGPDSIKPVTIYGYQSQLGFNKLRTRIINSEVKSYLKHKDFLWESGLKYERNRFYNNEHTVTEIDSVADSVNYNNRLIANRLMFYLQTAGKISRELNINAGFRMNYNSVNNETLFSPRAGIAYFPAAHPTVNYKFSIGIYNQPPFYMELKNKTGALNTSIKSQKSVHFIGGVNHSFHALGETLNFSSEVYYKLLRDQIPYKIDNLTINYLTDQKSKGYAMGADFAVNGEFVSGLRSAFRLSLMKTAEDIQGDYYYTKDGSGNTVKIEPGYLKRPTDQRLNFSVFFQDKFLSDPTYKVHLNMLYGSSLPVGPPQTPRYTDNFEIPSYKRVDIGFSKDLIDKESRKTPAFLKRNFNTLAIYLEVLNLLNIKNTVSYLWIADMNNNQYAVPNYLTSRQISFRIIANFKN
ncbi:TonB-dependent receptor plug domain-containing protein [Pedobacter sp. HMF7647]|uniref:TonB-dependent receptor plug domain-containing protein n=1 Tax=Hufsiella arboris TaxID=2695275 RepID=A0A7K1YCW0_9SPHI|nr:TonB-dependent receptor [Hufsiella arboris]MXV52422.1 TonB-dependent receptor plug domain-containing protein [Hufsiella arboris]